MSSQLALVVDELVMDAGWDVAGSISELNRGERNGLRAFAPFQEFEALSKLVRIGLPSMRSLVVKGLVEEGPMGVFGPTFRLTSLGRAVMYEIDSDR